MKTVIKKSSLGGVYQSGGKVVKSTTKVTPKKVVKTVTKKPINPADSYPANKDKRGVPTIGGGEGRRPPFKSGGKMKKCRGGCM